MRRATFALALWAASMDQLTGRLQAAAQTPGSPPSEARPSRPFTSHPYTSALRGVANYQSCGANARPAQLRAVLARLRAIEAEAEAKGLAPTLAQLRHQLQLIRSIELVIPCYGGPRAALANAGQALNAFQLWVTDQPSASPLPPDGSPRPG